MKPFSSKKVAIFPIGLDALNECAQIHASGFAHAWGDGEIKSLLDGAGMHGRMVRAGSQTAPALAFVIYRMGGSEAEIITIASHKSHRRKGHGRALMDEVIRHCLSERMDELFLEVAQTNQGAITLYKSLGFIKVGERMAYYQAGTGTDAPNALIMRLDLKN